MTKSHTYVLGSLLFIAGCSYSPPVTTDDVKLISSFSKDSLQFSITVPYDLLDECFQLDTLPTPSQTIILKTVLSDIDDALLKQIVEENISSHFEDYNVHYELINIEFNDDAFTFVYKINKRRWLNLANTIIQKHKQTVLSPIEPLFSKQTHLPPADAFKNTTLLLPCDSVSLPIEPHFLPNSPRQYRNGIHRGIDFQANWGTPVTAVSDGIIVRSDHHYDEVTPAFLKTMLENSKRTGHTPSDIFNHVLLGRAVIVDHGFDLVPGYRTISIYAHLSDIYPHITRGYKIKQGEVFGMTGNSGLMPAAEGSKDIAHLHYELILQNTDGEYYLGQNMDYDELLVLLSSIFK